MFICQSCNKLSAPGEKTNNKVVTTRPKSYYQKVTTTDEEGNTIILNGKLLGAGLETVQEIKTCYGCANAF